MPLGTVSHGVVHLALTLLYMKFSLPFLSCDMTIDINMGFSLNSKTKCNSDEAPPLRAVSSGLTQFAPASVLVCRVVNKLHFTIC